MVDTKKHPSVFISYSWIDSAIAEEIYNILKQVGVTVIKDNHTLEYKDSIKNFMNHIRSSDYALLLISDAYLKSKNCLYEVLQLLKDEDPIFHKVLPIIVDGTKIYSIHDKLSFVKYWEQEAVFLEDAIKQTERSNTYEAYSEVKLYREIAANLYSFLNKISSIKNITYKELKNQGFKPLFDKMDFNDLTYVIELLTIVSIKDVNKKEIALDEYINRFPPNTYYFTIRGRCAETEKKFDRARVFYEKALELDAKNTEALNQIGLMMHYHYKIKNQARTFYETAIKANPQLTITRLNLAALLNKEFDDPEAARFQYETILKYEPNCAKAYNNLGNYYRGKDMAIAEDHYRKAIQYDSNLIEARISYGNFLKVVRKQINEGNDQYKKAMELDTSGYYKEMLEVLVTSDKA